MHRMSYWKTIVISLGITTVSAALIVVIHITHVSGGFSTLANVLLMATLASSFLAVCGGAVCLWRDSLIESGKLDPIGASLNRVPSPGFLSTLGLRSLLGSAPRPGDIVEVKSLAEIQATLDADSALDGLPFMSEMHAYCGRAFRVHRRVDKIFDMRHLSGMRCIRDVVTLAAVRCNGTAHDGCQAECQILWKDAWLRRLPASTPVDMCISTDHVITQAVEKFEPDGYICQMTRLWESSQPMSRFDIRQDLRPLLLGNVSLVAYVIALLTRLFIVFQQYRRGAGFPHMPDRLALKLPEQPPQPGLSLGQRVMVQSRAHISQTLINNRTKGLYYDRDMVRFCGNESVVQMRVERVIHEATGKMVVMKTPSWILRDFTATGEFHRLCPQHEHIFWREAWLRSADIAPQATSTSTRI